MIYCAIVNVKENGISNGVILNGEASVIANEIEMEIESEE